MLVDSAPGTPMESSVSVIGGVRGSAGGTVTLYCCTRAAVLGPVCGYHI